MKTNRTELAYQEAAVRNASAVELVIILYDVLARDLHDAIAAMESGNIEGRSAKIKHGFLALQQLEGTLNMDEGGELATNMSRFYSMLRSQMLKAQVEQDGEILRELVDLLFTVREAWAELNSRLAVPPQEAQPRHDSSANWKA